MVLLVPGPDRCNGTFSAKNALGMLWGQNLVLDVQNQLASNQFDSEHACLAMCSLKTRPTRVVLRCASHP